MVAATPLPPELPELSPRESELLAHFLILRYDFIALAETNKLLPQQLLAFAHSPAVTAHLAAFKAFAETAFTLRLLEARVKALDILERVATTSENAIEQRRAASTIFRGTGLQRERRTQTPPDPRFTTPSRGAASATCPGREPWEAAPTSQAPEGRHTAAPANDASVTESNPAGPLSSLPTPLSPLSPAAILKQVTQALGTRNNPAATLRAHLASDAQINGQPARDSLDTLPRLIPASKVTWFDYPGIDDHKPGPPETFTSRSYLIHESTQQTRITATLTREPGGPWLISALLIGPNTS